MLQEDVVLRVRRLRAQRCQIQFLHPDEGPNERRVDEALLRKTSELHLLQGGANAGVDDHDIGIEVLCHRSKGKTTWLKTTSFAVPLGLDAKTPMVSYRAAGCEDQGNQMTCLMAGL